MNSLQEAAREFLAQKRIAVAGVSRDPRQPANAIYRRLREGGREVFAVNPNADRVEGDPCYPRLGAIPDGVDAVVIATRPAISEQIVQDCLAAGARREGMLVIDGACPMMYLEPVDFFHKCARWVLGVTGRLPRPEAS
jgi:predicted CoA-binding protein